MTQQKQTSPILHPAMADNYRKIIKNLGEFLNKEDHRAEAHLHLRSLIEKIILRRVQIKVTCLLIYMVIWPEFYQ